MPPANGAAVGRSRLAWRSPLLCRAGVHARRTVKNKKVPFGGGGRLPHPRLYFCFKNYINHIMLLKIPGGVL